MKIRLLLILLIALKQAVTYAQDRELRGKVYDKGTQEVIPGVGVKLDKSGAMTTTNEAGEFRIVLPADEQTLTFTYIGYISQTTSVSNENQLNVYLEADQQQLSEVVVTGYSTQDRRFIAGSITTLKADELIDIPVSGFNQLLQGKAAGVQVSANSGTPGAGINFRIRGSNSINASVAPLYVIDGVFVNSNNAIQTGLGNQAPSNPLADINPADIEDIVVLKDANATAIYGSLGANGVVIVTTKRGSLNAKPKITLNAAHGLANATNKFPFVSGPETALLVNESVLNTAIDRGQDPATVSLPFDDPSSLPTYDRVDGLFRTAQNQNYDLSIQGGTDKSTYYNGISYLKEQSVVRPSNFERISGRFNYDNRLSDKLKVGTSISLNRTHRNVSSSDNNPRGVINSAIFPRSYLPIFNEDGTYARYGNFDNHYALIEHLNNDAVGWRTIGNLFGEYKFTPALTLRTSWSIDNNSVYENNYNNTLTSVGIASGGSANSYETKNIGLLNEQVLTYINSFGQEKQHNINALIGNTFNTTLSQGTSASGTGFATNSITAISDAAIRLGSSYRSQSNLVSFFGKASYTYGNKYTLDASLRADGSSRFGANARWGYFPSGGITWRASQEPFIARLGVFDELKFRASLGLSGNQNGIADYAALGLWSSGYNYLENPGTNLTQLANPDLTWESTRQLDLGVDIGILKNRLSINVDYYNKYTYDLLLNVPIPYRSGLTNFLQNYGAVRNEGFEITLHGLNINSEHFSWTTDFNISHNVNRIESLASDIALGASGRNISILREGYSVGSFQLYKQLYVDPETGNAVYEDVNDDGIITSADRQIVGNALPKYFGGLTNTFKWKSFDLSVFFFFQQGNKIMNMNTFFLVHGGTQNNIGFDPLQLSRWQQPGDITDIPRLTTYSGNPTENGGGANNYGGNVASLSSRYLEDGSFIRLRHINFGYALPTAFSSRLGLNNARIYATATNLFTFTRYSGLDPEVSSQSANQNTAGYDWATVPQPRTIQLGASITF